MAVLAPFWPFGQELADFSWILLAYLQQPVSFCGSWSGRSCCLYVKIEPGTPQSRIPTFSHQNGFSNVLSNGHCCVSLNSIWVQISVDFRFKALYSLTYLVENVFKQIWHSCLSVVFIFYGRDSNDLSVVKRLAKRHSWSQIIFLSSEQGIDKYLGSNLWLIQHEIKYL